MEAEVELLNCYVDSRRTSRFKKPNDGGASLDPPTETWGSVRRANVKPTGSPLLLNVARSATLSPTASSITRTRVNALAVDHLIVPPPLHVRIPSPHSRELSPRATRQAPAGCSSAPSRNRCCAPVTHRSLTAALPALGFLEHDSHLTHFRRRARS